MGPLYHTGFKTEKYVKMLDDKCCLLHLLFTYNHVFARLDPPHTFLTKFAHFHVHIQVFAGICSAVQQRAEKGSAGIVLQRFLHFFALCHNILHYILQQSAVDGWLKRANLARSRRGKVIHVGRRVGVPAICISCIGTDKNR